MNQSWFFVFSECSIFRKRYIKFVGTREDCAAKLKYWRLEGVVNAILSEPDFKKAGFLEKGFKELDVEKE